VAGEQNLQREQTGGSRILQRFPPAIEVSKGFWRLRDWHSTRRRHGVAAQRQDLKERAFRLASRVFRMLPELATTSAAHAYVARQLLSATASVGANLEEGVAASSRRDMASKYSIALRESREAKCWSRLLSVDARWTARAEPITQETDEFIAMLTVAVKKLRQPVQTQSALRVSARSRRSRRVRPRRRG
jgi:four helix bundle protein